MAAEHCLGPLFTRVYERDYPAFAEHAHPLRSNPCVRVTDGDRTRDLRSQNPSSRMSLVLLENVKGTARQVCRLLTPNRR